MTQKNKFGRKLFSKSYKLTSDLAAGASRQVDITQSDKDNYAPFTTLTVINATTKDILVEIGTASTTYAGDKAYYIKQGVTMSIKADENFSFYDLVITNKDATNSITVATENVYFVVTNYD